MYKVTLAFGEGKRKPIVKEITLPMEESAIFQILRKHGRRYKIVESNLPFFVSPTSDIMEVNNTVDVLEEYMIDPQVMKTIIIYYKHDMKKVFDYLDNRYIVIEGVHNNHTLGKQIYRLRPDLLLQDMNETKLGGCYKYVDWNKVGAGLMSNYDILILRDIGQAIIFI